MPIVYAQMTIDILHHGHINIISRAREYGDVVVGLLTDAAIAEEELLPYLTYEQRKQIVENIVGVTRVVPQYELDSGPNILKYRPEFVIHGTDWREGPLKPYRERTIAALAQYGGQLIEIPYTEGVSSSALAKQMFGLGTTPDIRRRTLRRLLAAKPLSRFIETHSPISALIAETVTAERNGKIRQFDGFWSSSLTDSTARGKPDIEALETNLRLANINEIFGVTTKPLIMDGDTGGKREHFELNVRAMERLGVSSVIIEDKAGLKRNSLLGNDVVQSQEDVEVFCDKIRAGRHARMSEDFMIIARIESLILEKGLDDAMQRARAYVAAGADGIMIHSRERTPDEVFEFATMFRAEWRATPLICVPTSYSSVTEEELAEHGFNIVIYANHLLRAAYPAMQRVAREILRNGRSAEVDADLMSINEILQVIPGSKE